MKLGQVLGIASISGKKEEAESDSTPTPTTPVNTGPSPGRVQTIIDTWRRTTGINLTHDHVSSHSMALRRWREGSKPKST